MQVEVFVQVLCWLCEVKVQQWQLSELLLPAQVQKLQIQAGCCPFG